MAKFNRIFDVMAMERERETGRERERERERERDCYPEPMLCFLCYAFFIIDTDKSTTMIDKGVLRAHSKQISRTNPA